MLVIVVAMSAYGLLGYGEFPSGGVGMVVAMFTVATLRPRRVAAALYPTTVVALLLGVDGQGVVWSQVAQAVLVCLGAWILGEGTRRWTERIEHAAVDEERTLAAERTRIAQELHDVVSHHMSVVALQTGVAEYVLDTDRETARRAIADAGAASRDALQEMRRMLDALRTRELPASYSPQPGLADVDTLVDRMQAAGLEVEVTHTGTPQALPPGLDLCAYRVMQESLTNVLRHAGPARARVLVDHGERILTVTVLDDGRGPRAGADPAPRPPRGGDSGRGVRGMRERAELYGGTLDAGAGAHGGFAVVLRLPVPEGIATPGTLPDVLAPEQQVR
jgi:signal transduction histidine kinase